MAIVDGHACLNVYALGPDWVRDDECVAAVINAVRHAGMRYITRLSLGYSDPHLTVDVVIPVDGSLDLNALQRDLSTAARDAVLAVHQRKVA